MSVYIPNLIESVVQKVSTSLGVDVFFDFGHFSEIQKNLSQKDSAITVTNQKKYPLVWLVMDFAEKRGNMNTYAELSLNIIITTGTSKESTMKERRDSTFLPVLYPIYEELLRQFKATIYFVYTPNIEHTKIDRPYWSGDKDGGLSNVFSDPIDAIQIENLKIKVKRPSLIC